MLISAIIYGARLSRNDVLHARRVTRTSNEETSSRSTWQAKGFRLRAPCVEAELGSG